MRELRPLVLAATILVTSVALVGCSAVGSDESRTESSSASDTASPRPVTTVTSEAQADNIAAECLREFGWDVTVDGSGGIEVHTTTAQHDQLQEDRESCNELIAYRDWTDADYETAYEGLLDSLSCLEENGYATPSDTPSFQVFMEQRTMNSSSMWDPYSEVDPSEFAAVFSRCPQPDPIY